MYKTFKTDELIRRGRYDCGDCELTGELANRLDQMNSEYDHLLAVAAARGLQIAKLKDQLESCGSKLDAVRETVSKGANYV